MWTENEIYGWWTNKEYKSIKFQTLSLPCFNYYREIFYNEEKIKIIPNNIDNLLTAKGLAYWIMDDGYKSRKGIYIFSSSKNKLIDLIKSSFLPLFYYKLDLNF